MVFIASRKLKLTCLKCNGVVKINSAKKIIINSANINAEAQKLNISCHVWGIKADRYSGISCVVNSYVQVQFQACSFSWV